MAEIYTGAVPGRIVWGHPAEPQIKKDQNTNQPVLRDGKQVEQWVFGVAFPKAHFMSVLWPVMEQERMTKFPNGAPPNFSYKIKDGDTAVSSDGTPYNTMPGRAGCYILTISTEAFAPPIFKSNGAGGWTQMQGNEIKCGDFVGLVLDFVCNKPTNAQHTPGLYVNPKAVIFAAYGEEIKNAKAFDPNTLGQGAGQFQLPAGASLTPTMPTANVGLPNPMMPGQAQPAGIGGTPMPGVPGAMPGQMSPAPQMQPATGAFPSNPAVQPAPDFIHGAPGQAMPGQPAPFPGGMPQMPGMG